MRRAFALCRSLSGLLLACVAGFAQAQAPGDEGVFWKVERGSATSYLLGTVHVGAPCEVALRERVVRAITQAKSLVLEIDFGPNMQEESIKLMSMPPGESLRALIGDELFTRVLNRLDMPPAVLDATKPIFVMLQLAMYEFRETAPLDMMLMGVAQSRRVPIIGLETMQEQGASLTALSIKKQARLLELSLRHPDVEALSAKELLKLYETGAIETMRKKSVMPLSQTIPAAERAEAEALRTELYAPLVSPRNRIMFERMRAGLMSGGLFVGVGALHLPGDDGLIALLRGAGFKVTPADAGAPIASACADFKRRMQAQ
jgi:uncharacterized protein